MTGHEDWVGSRIDSANGNDDDTVGLLAREREREDE